MWKRISNLIRGFLSLFVGGLERQNPEALLEVEKEHLREQIARYNQGLASHAGLCERLMTQVKRLETEERDLRAKTAANLKAGHQQAAGQYALRLETVTSELGENRKQLEQAEETYKNLVKARDVSIHAARAKIETLKHSLDDLKIKQATAELTEMASGMVSTIGGSGDTLDRLHEMVEEEREKAAGRARVAHDSLNTSDLQMKEAEQQALADQALADFAVKEGISFTPAKAAAAKAEAAAGPARSMGPGAQTQ
ncbi:MAG TPA: PspA/IM30 family protein [Thermoanaerobaculia bacterium]|nr:PspA/IM30 family protein [Thermoanaerobaculia bacterium]